MNAFYRFAFIVFGLLAASVLGADDPALAAELKKLEGTWEPIENIRDGVPSPKEELNTRRTVIKDGVYQNYHQGQADTKGGLKLVAKEKGVLHLDLTPTNGPGEGKTVQCIVDFLGDDGFRLCMPAEPDGPRPTEFASPIGRLQVLRTYKRLK